MEDIIEVIVDLKMTVHEHCKNRIQNDINDTKDHTSDYSDLVILMFAAHYFKLGRLWAVWFILGNLVYLTLVQRGNHTFETPMRKRVRIFKQKT